jgi:Ca2+-binding RTX toxin-like protein
MSRIYGGIHFLFDHSAGNQTGKRVADWVWNSSRLSPETSISAYQDGQKLLVCGTLGDDQIMLRAIGSDLAVFQNGRLVSRFERNGIGHVVLSGSAGNDRLEVRHSLDVTSEIFGGDGDDRIFGAKRSNWIYGQAGNDFLCGGGADDVLRGGAGDDSLMGLAGRDQLFGDSGWDTLCGGLGDDELTANRLEDRILGKAGRDQILWI